jgi:ComF family protein
MCEDCTASLQVHTPCCYLCRAPTQLGRTCRSCRAGANSRLISINCAVDYSGAAKDLLWALKFDRAQAAADIIASIMASRYSANTPSDALIVPVPTAAKRVRMRGYDQAVLIAKAYASKTGRQYAPLLQRYGSQEQKGAGREQRHAQLSGALRAKPSPTLNNARIILVDDVVTTGATLEQASEVLITAGAKAVAAIAFARA